MPVVLVHGVPDTHRVWDKVIARLSRRDVVTLSLPGFGCPVPDGFPATKEAYVGWLLNELSRLPQPIDVVGHDWGALLVVCSVLRHCESRGHRPPRVRRTWQDLAGRPCT